MPTRADEFEGWTVSIDAIDGRRTLSDREVERLVELYSDFSGVVAVGAGRVGVTFSVDARDLRPPVALPIVSAIDFACQVFTLHLTAIGQAGWTIVDVHVRTFTEHDAEI